MCREFESLWARQEFQGVRPSGLTPYFFGVRLVCPEFNVRFITGRRWSAPEVIHRRGGRLSTRLGPQTRDLAHGCGRSAGAGFPGQIPSLFPQVSASLVTAATVQQGENCRRRLLPNLTQAVGKVFRGKGWLEQEEFAKSRAHHNFYPAFATRTAPTGRAGLKNWRPTCGGTAWCRRRKTSRAWMAGFGKNVWLMAGSGSGVREGAVSALFAEAGALCCHSRRR